MDKKALIVNVLLVICAIIGFITAKNDPHSLLTKGVLFLMFILAGLITVINIRDFRALRRAAHERKKEKDI